MKQTAFHIATLVGISAICASPILAQQPPDVVKSDNWSNTAMGSYALGSLNIQSAPNNVGIDNTASGAGALFSNTIGAYNTADGANALSANQSNANVAVGYEALMDNTTGALNTAVGTNSLVDNTIGFNNTAVGMLSMSTNTTGSLNTALGASALGANQIGSNNTAVGYQSLGGTGANLLPKSGSASANTAVGGLALGSEESGSYNTAVGYAALASNGQGIDNSALGYEALHSSQGSTNTAVGYKSSYSTTTGINNLSSGAFALYANTTGNYNVAEGDEALLDNIVGASNTAIGRNALHANTSGSNNIAVGQDAGYALTTGNNNVDIANQGIGGESGTIRIGAPGIQIATYIAGINTTHVTGSAVVITSNGQLGVLASSEKYKTAISSLGSDSDKVFGLRPVTFQLKTEPHGAKQYGLIAEEVDKIYPDLVIRDDAGTIQGVRYDELAPILLKVVQQQKRLLVKEDERLRDLQNQFDQFRRQYAALNTAAREARVPLAR
jgi:hypothetical protein